MKLKPGDVVLYPLGNADSFVVTSGTFESISGYLYVEVVYLEGDGTLAAELESGRLFDDAIYLPAGDE